MTCRPTRPVPPVTKTFTRRARAGDAPRAGEPPGSASVAPAWTSRRRTASPRYCAASGDHAALVRRPRPRLAVAELVGQRGRGRAAEGEADQLAVGVPAEMHPRHRLLADVAALRVRHRAQLVEAHLLRDGALVDLGAEPREAGEDAPFLEERGSRGHGAVREERREHLVPGGARDEVEAVESA